MDGLDYSPCCDASINRFGKCARCGAQVLPEVK